MEVASEDWLIIKLRCAVNELMLVLITEAIFQAPLSQINPALLPIPTSAPKRLTAMTGALVTALAGRLSFTVGEARYITCVVWWREITKI